MSPPTDFALRRTTGMAVRGGRRLSWMMLMASHALAGGRFQARTMLSLDAIGVTTRGYPPLLRFKVL